jgi:NADH dehydrogenase
MQAPWRLIPVSLRRDMVAGSVAGFVAGLVFWWALEAQSMTSTVRGLLGLDLSGAQLGLHLLVAIPVGATFGAISHYKAQGYASAVSCGTLYGLLWWIAGPLTLGPLLDGQGPTWSLEEASAAFPSLIGHLLYGGLTGIGSHILVASYLRLRSELEADIPTELVKVRVVILGGGFGGTGTAQRLEQLFSRDQSIEITLVSQSNYLLFTPMLAEVASSGLEAQHISAPVRAFCPHTRFHRTEVTAIDTSAQVVWVRAGPSVPSEALPYDHLVLSLGSVPNFYGLPGLEKHSFSMKTLEDASTLRNHVISLLEHADSEPDDEERRRQLTFVVAGGGFAGTETISELFDLVHSVLRYYPNIRAGELRFVLIHPRDRILPELSPELANYALHKLQGRGIEFLLNSRVAGATSEGVLLDAGDLVSTYTLVWTAGNQPNPLLRTLPCERNRAGAVIVDDTLRVNGFDNLWAVGDCAQIPDPDHEGESYPPTAQHAQREGKVVAENLAAVMRGKRPKQFRFRTIGVLVGLGHRTAAAEIRGRRFSGLLAWFMWRSIYLGKLPGMEKKVRVALDWAIDLFFPRDIVLTSAFYRPTPPQLVQTDQNPVGSHERPQSTATEDHVK